MSSLLQMSSCTCDRRMTLHCIAARADSGSAPTKDDPAFFNQSSKCRHPRWATAGPAQRNEWAASCHKVLSAWTRPYSISQHSATDIRHLWHPVSRQLIPTERTSLESLIRTFILQKNEIIFKTAGRCKFLFNSGAGGGDDWKGTAVALLSVRKEHVIQCNVWLSYCALAFKWSLFPKMCTIHQFSHFYLLSRFVREV